MRISLREDQHNRRGFRRSERFELPGHVKSTVIEKIQTSFVGLLKYTD